MTLAALGQWPRRRRESAFDLAELRGYGYHSGVVFAAYTAGRSRAIALGGRYDEVGRIFGRARPATGFSLDLRELVEAVPHKPLTRLRTLPQGGSG